MPPVRYRDPSVEAWIRQGRSPAEIRATLQAEGTFHFPPLSTGLYSAALVHTVNRDPTGYRRTWIRDNVHVAHALYETGAVEAALKCARGLTAFMATQAAKMEAAIIADQAPARANDRPHIRFDGEKLAEVEEPWTHAQNDALGYWLWLVGRILLPRDGQNTAELVAQTVRYLAAIRYWADPDSGHWEEAPKVSASSIGCVVAGLQAVIRAAEADAKVATTLAQHGASVARLTGLAEQGKAALEAILPAESTDPGLARAEDAALLFLLEPLRLIDVDGPAGQAILHAVQGRLVGEHGVRRYRRDSYWAPDFRRWQGPRSPGTAAEYHAARDKIAVDGLEAQWALFDPVLCIIYGRSVRPDAAQRRDWHLHRSLGQLTGPDDPGPRLRCVEAYCLEDGEWVANDHVPLLWTQANLLLALHTMASPAPALTA